MEIFGATIQESNLQQSLRASLNNGDVEGVKEMELSSLGAFVRKVFKDELDETKKAFWKPKLTWSTNKPPPAPNDRIVGEWNQRLLYIDLKMCVIQNGLLMNRAGQRITVADLSDAPHTWVEPKTGTVHIAPSDRQRAIDGMAAFRKAAEASDPLYCALCPEKFFRAKNWDDRTKHMYQEHPVEFAEMVGAKVVDKITVTSVIPDPEPTVKNEAGNFVCCEKEFSSLGRVNQHRRVSKNHQG